jgi:hypothetical protein
MAFASNTKGLKQQSVVVIHSIFYAAGVGQSKSTDVVSFSMRMFSMLAVILTPLLLPRAVQAQNCLAGTYQSGGTCAYAPIGKSLTGKL